MGLLCVFGLIECITGLCHFVIFKVVHRKLLKCKRFLKGSCHFVSLCVTLIFKVVHRKPLIYMRKTHLVSHVSLFWPNSFIYARVFLRSARL